MARRRAGDTRHVGLVRIHCYSCAHSVDVDEQATEQGVLAAGWAVKDGETLCPDCARARDLEIDAPAAPAALAVPTPPGAPGGHPMAQPELQPFGVSPVSGESKFARSLRLMSASFSILRHEPRLLVFPVVSFALSALVGIFCFSTWAPQTGSGSSGRNVLLIPSLIAAYPLTFLSNFCGVALAAVLAARLEGRSMTLGEGWSAANRRIGAIAAWTLVVCTVGAFLRLLQERLPLAGRVAAGLVGMAWSLATAFAVPVLAYEGLGPIETLKRSSEIFKRRWGAQIGGSIGIGMAGAVLAIPFAVILFVGLAKTQGGAALVAVGAVGLFATGAVIGTVEQIYRVYLYRNAVGLDVSGGPFSQEDLQRPVNRRR